MKVYKQLVGELEILYKTKNLSKSKITKSEDCEKFFRSIWSDSLEYKEEMYLIPLNRANNTLGYFKVSSGGLAGTVADIRMIMQELLMANAHSFILAHNHPSGNGKPSDQDKQLTSKLKQAAKLLDFNLLDHLILTKNNYYSFADNGLI